MEKLITLLMTLVNLIGINFFDARLDNASMKEKCQAAATNILKQADILKDKNSQNKTNLEEYQQTMSSLKGILGSIERECRWRYARNKDQFLYEDLTKDSESLKELKQFNKRLNYAKNIKVKKILENRRAYEELVSQ